MIDKQDGRYIYQDLTSNSFTYQEQKWYNQTPSLDDQIMEQKDNSMTKKRLLMRLQESERCAVHYNNIYITRAECNWDVAALEDNC
jgi:RAB protein geranylgeranyltransferase component A